MYHSRVPLPEFRNRWNMGLGGWVACLIAGAVCYLGGPRADDVAFTLWLIGLFLQIAIIWEAYGPASRRKKASRGR
jgi:hypothetical protein